MYLESRDIEKASTFNTKESYVKNVNTTLSRDADKINAWLKNPDSTRLRLDDLENNDVIGRIIIKDANHTGIATKSKLILQKNNSGGYYILTNPIFP